MGTIPPILITSIQIFAVFLWHVIVRHQEELRAAWGTRQEETRPRIRFCLVRAGRSSRPASAPTVNVQKQRPASAAPSRRRDASGEGARRRMTASQRERAA